MSVNVENEGTAETPRHVNQPFDDPGRHAAILDKAVSLACPVCTDLFAIAQTMWVAGIVKLVILRSLGPQHVDGVGEMTEPHMSWLQLGQVPAT